MRHNTRLSTAAQTIIKNYLALPFPSHSVNAPYFNNQRAKTRAALRVLIGKGTPTDIVEEVKIMAVRDRIDLAKLSDTDLKKFLVDHNLGVDCSALAYYILETEGSTRGHRQLEKQLIFPNAISFIRKILTRFRPVENIDVATLASEHNSQSIALAEIQAGDLIVLWRTGMEHKLNHILVVTEVDDKKISYVHSFRWSKEGVYEHGVREGTVLIFDSTKNLSGQIWQEKNKIGEDNETLEHVKMAEKVEIRRLNLFT